MADKPLFIHDCDRCIFLGTYKNEDLYFCVAGNMGLDTVIARYGNKGYEYTSGLSFADSVPVLAEAKRRAKEKNLL